MTTPKSNHLFNYIKEQGQWATSTGMEMALDTCKMMEVELNGYLKCLRSGDGHPSFDSLKSRIAILERDRNHLEGVLKIHLLFAPSPESDALVLAALRSYMNKRAP